MTPLSRKLLLAALIGAAFPLSGLDSKPAGLAQSEAPFHVVRANRTFESGNQPFLIRHGDRIRAGEGIVQVSAASGHAILLDSESEVQLGEDRRFRVVSGAFAAKTPVDQETTIEIDGLEFQSLDSRSESQIAVQSYQSGEVDAINLGQPVRVSSLPSGNQVAVLGDGDIFRFTKLLNGDWELIEPRGQFSPDPTDTGRGNQVKKGGIFGLLGRGGAAAGTGGASAGAGAAAGTTGGGAAVAAGGGTAAAGAITAGGITLGGSVTDDDEQREESTPTNN